MKEVHPRIGIQSYPVYRADGLNVPIQSVPERDSNLGGRLGLANAENVFFAREISNLEEGWVFSACGECVFFLFFSARLVRQRTASEPAPPMVPAPPQGCRVESSRVRSLKFTSRRRSDRMD